MYALGLVPVEQRIQIDIPFEVVRLAIELAKNACGLLIDALDRVRQKSLHTELNALMAGKQRSLVRPRVEEAQDPRWERFMVWHRHFSLSTRQACRRRAPTGGTPRSLWLR